MFDYSGVDTLTSQGGPARGAAAPHGAPGRTAQAADRRHDPLGGEPRARGHDHRDRCARGGPEPGDHQPSFPDQGTAADRDPAVPGRRVPQCLSRGSGPHGGLARGGLDGDGRARLPARDLRAEQARRVVRILGRAEVPARPTGASAPSGTGPTTTWCAYCARGSASRAATRRSTPRSSPTVCRP